MKQRLIDCIGVSTNFIPLGVNSALTHWGRVTHICICNVTNIGPDNGLSPGRRQAIIWTNAGTLLIGPWGTNFSEILIGIQTFSFRKMRLKMSSAKWRPFCLGRNVLRKSSADTRSSHHQSPTSMYIMNSSLDGFCMYKQYEICHIITNKTSLICQLTLNM